MAAVSVCRHIPSTGSSREVRSTETTTAVADCARSRHLFVLAAVLSVRLRLRKISVVVLQVLILVPVTNLPVNIRIINSRLRCFLLDRTLACITVMFRCLRHGVSDDPFAFRVVLTNQVQTYCAYALGFGCTAAVPGLIRTPMPFSLLRPSCASGVIG